MLTGADRIRDQDALRLLLQKRAIERGFHGGLDFLGVQIDPATPLDRLEANEAYGLHDMLEDGDAIRKALEPTHQPIRIDDRSFGVDEEAHRSVISQGLRT